MASQSYNREDYIILYQDTNDELSFLPAHPHDRTEQSLTKTQLNNENYLTDEVQIDMVSISDTNLFAFAKSCTSQNYCKLILYSINRGFQNQQLYPKVVEIADQHEIQTDMSEFAFNQRRGLLAGGANCQKEIAYHLWKPAEDGFHLLRRTKYLGEAFLRKGPYLYEYDITSMDFTADGHLIAVLSENMSLTITDVDSNTLCFSMPWSAHNFLFRSSCRWNGDSTKLFLLYGRNENAFVLLDPEKGVIVAKSQKSFELTSLEPSRLDPNLFVCELSNGCTYVVFDSRISLYAPIHYLNDGSNESDISFMKKYIMKLHYSKNPARYRVNWNSTNSYELVCMSDSRIGIIDLRTQKILKLVDNEMYNAFCCFS